MSSEPSTPYLALDVDVMRANLGAMATRMRERGVGLRPHAKTHKCVEIAREQLALGAHGLTVATISEAETFAASGVRDLFIAYPIWAAGNRGERLRAVAEQTALIVGVDSSDAARQIARALAGSPVHVLLEIDCGHHRSGVLPADAGELATAVERAGLEVSGIFTFPGHSYDPVGRATAATDEARALALAAQACRAVGIEVAIRSGGSTPSAEFADADVLTELRPGVYVFNDAQQAELGTCDWADVALVAMGTVVSRRDRSFILDAGSKTLGADRPAWTTGWGRLPDHPGARVVALSEHHATVQLPEDADRPALGDVLRIAPNHVCNAVNLADEFVVMSGGAAIDRWRIAARGANT
jgi:D-serine deaminase-like pyridoxal phosphate-dependent protein